MAVSPRRPPGPTPVDDAWMEGVLTVEEALAAENARRVAQGLDPWPPIPTLEDLYYGQFEE
jgi:hypothetical protein